MEKTMVRQAVLLQPMEDDGGADIHLQPMEDPTLEQVEAPEGGCGPWEACAGASSWQDLWTHGERSPHQGRFAGRTCDPVGDPTLEQFAPEGLHPMEGTHAGAVCEELQPMGRTHIGEVHGGLSPMGGTHAGAGAECEESSP
ncbi:AN1-type zinc finger protein 5-like [Grus japonensis]|uniref:AN1-type zinc finger protein 5-like n=1 Tax=Grus japonensis TaxID=30415 RepID=A0ABC9WE90_GRUJA